MFDERRPSNDSDLPPFALPAHDTVVLSEFIDTEGVVVKDIYCIECGYNLRGLRGPTIRCPECGADNPIEIAAIPAPFIKEALRHMESAPTGCVAMSLLTCVGLAIALGALLASDLKALVCPVVLLVIAMFGWPACYASAREVYENKPGWRIIVRDLHLVAALFLPMVASGAALVASCHARYGRVQPLWAAAFALSIPLLIISLKLYRRTRRMIATMQRDAAVRMASDRLRGVYQRLYDRRRRR